MKRTRCLRGSNQYRNKNRDTWKFYLLFYILAVFLFLDLAMYFKGEGMGKAYAEAPIISPLAQGDDPRSKLPELAPLPERQRVTLLIRRYFGADANQAIKVFTCESGLRAGAINDRNSDGLPDVGIAQIHIYPSDPFTIADMQDPMKNLLEAKNKFDHRGWQPWDSSKHCWGGGE